MDTMSVYLLEKNPKKDGKNDVFPKAFLWKKKRRKIAPFPRNPYNSVMPATPARILEDLSPFYREKEFPVLMHQYETWLENRPLRGLRVIDASPVFRNTCAKYAALLAAGADLTAAISSLMPHDPEIAALLPRYGISVIDAEQAGGTYDVVMDCAGVLSHVPSRCGYVELTRSGAERYAECTQPVWMVDAGRIKQIETCLGTGESFFRALKALGIGGWLGKKLVVIGYGKVGRGIVLHALGNGMNVTVADVEEKDLPHPSVSFVHAGDGAALNHALRDAFCAVTATGRLHALSGVVAPSLPCSSGVLLANMGVENEWGPEIPKERILNEGRPLNFILPDPTRMCYIDPPLALHNQGAAEIAAGRGIPGLFPPPQEMEEQFLSLIRSRGSIPQELLDHIS